MAGKSSIGPYLIGIKRPFGGLKVRNGVEMWFFAPKVTRYLLAYLMLFKSSVVEYSLVSDALEPK